MQNYCATNPPTQEQERERETPNIFNVTTKKQI